MSSIKAFESLSGRISGGCTLSGSLSCSGGLSGKVSLPTNFERYNGDYEVTPDAFNAQTLPTANKLLTQDVVVKKFHIMRPAISSRVLRSTLQKRRTNMPNSNVNKVIYGGRTLIDLTGDTVSPDKLLTGVTAHDKSGAAIEGTCTRDVDSTDATVSEAEILLGKTAYARGAKLTGTMPNKGAIAEKITTKAQAVTVPQGYHDGSGKVSIDSVEQSKLVGNNIRQGVTILGVDGTLEPSSEVKSQAKTVTPKTTQQVVLPDENIDYLSQVTVAAIPYVESDNSAGGITVTIAG